MRVRTRLRTLDVQQRIEGVGLVPIGSAALTAALARSAACLTATARRAAAPLHPALRTYRTYRTYHTYHTPARRALVCCAPCGRAAAPRRAAPRRAPVRRGARHDVKPRAEWAESRDHGLVGMQGPGLGLGLGLGLGSGLGSGLGLGLGLGLGSPAFAPGRCAAGRRR